MDRNKFRIIVRQALALTKANLKSRYRSTWTGFLWVILFPAFIYGAQSFAFHFVLKINIENYPLFLLAGILPWTFISSSIEMSTGAFVNSGRLLKSFPIHPGAILFSQIADNFLNYCVAFLILLVPIAVYLSWSFARLVYLPLPLISLFIFVTGLSFALATINVFFRDTKFIMSFLMQVMFFLTPIFYPRELIPAAFHWVWIFNPIYRMLAPFQGLSRADGYIEYLPDLGLSFTISFSILVTSILIWRAKRNDLYFRI